MASETKFTPGPWSKGSRNRDCVWLQGKKEPGNGMGEEFDWIDCNSEANASLIAAAPDLYIELQMLCNCIEGSGLGDLPPEVEAQISFSRDALAKARGES